MKIISIPVHKENERGINFWKKRGFDKIYRDDEKSFVRLKRDVI
ncbi:MAG: hypothetical protein Q3988_06060 [Gemella sp.]|nr:hypothetical protein [Gemella sp.]